MLHNNQEDSLGTIWISDKSASPSSPAWQFSLPHATLGLKRRFALNGEDSTFSAGFAAPGVGRNPEATGLLKRSWHRDQSRLGSAL
jgi:hypothetical protein